MSLELADKELRFGHFSSAVNLCDEVLAASPKDAGALFIKGMALVRMGRLPEAVEALRSSLETRPDDFLTLEWLHGAFMQLRRFPEAATTGERALAIRPRESNLLMSVSEALLKIGESRKAVILLEGEVQTLTGNPGIILKLGQAYERAKRNRDALTQYMAIISQYPTVQDAYDRANRILLEEGRFQEALVLSRQAIAKFPKKGGAELQSARALGQMGRMEEAREAAVKAYELDNLMAEPVANWFEAHGRPEDADAIRNKSLRVRPVQGQVYYGMAKSRKITEADRQLVSQMQSVLKESKLPPNERVPLLRALGKAADDLADYEQAMRRFDEAAGLAMNVYGAEYGFDARRLDAARESLLSFYDAAFLARHSDLGVGGHSPIFVLGMIRSGTTLVQQILTSHPSIGDAGEQPFWTIAFPAVVDLNARSLRKEAFIEARDSYPEVLKRFDPNSPIISNKWPMNYSHAGLLLLAYPDAKIIHVARHPVDTALSIWMTDLGEPAPEFSYRRKDIVAVYRDYQKRMNHWEKVLPPGSVFTIRYEDLVADQEEWSRKLIAFCGLEWDERCLDFYKGDRRVQTPSMVQVRKPIYSSSTEKWKRYKKWLGEFSALL